MPVLAPIQGDLQTQIMATLWRLGSGNVEQVRSALPSRYRGAYTTVQTVLNRLAERELLQRERQGNRFVYRPKLSEAEYLSRTISGSLAGASADARQAALATIIGGLDAGELSQMQKLAADITGARKGRRR